MSTDVIRKRDTQSLAALCEILGQESLAHLIQKTIAQKDWALIEALASSPRICEQHTEELSPALFNQHSDKIDARFWINHWIAKSLRHQDLEIKVNLPKYAFSRIYDGQKQWPVYDEMPRKICRKLLENQYQTLGDHKDVYASKTSPLEDAAIALACALGDRQCIDAVGLTPERLLQTDAIQRLISHGLPEIAQEIPDGYLGKGNLFGMLMGGMNSREWSEQEFAHVVRSVFPEAPANGPSYVEGDFESFSSFFKHSKSLTIHWLHPRLQQFYENNPRYLRLHDCDMQGPNSLGRNISELWTGCALLHLCDEKVQAYAASLIDIQSDESSPYTQTSNSSFTHFLQELSKNEGAQKTILDPDSTLVSLLKNHPQPQDLMRLTFEVEDGHLPGKRMSIAGVAMRCGFEQTLHTLFEIGLSSQALQKQVSYSDRNDYFEQKLIAARAHEARNAALSTLNEFKSLSPAL